jgi:hypothetical protein
MMSDLFEFEIEFSSSFLSYNNWYILLDGTKYAIVLQLSIHLSFNLFYAIIILWSLCYECLISLKSFPKSGKTLLAKTLARFVNVPFVIADATSLTQVY